MARTPLASLGAVFALAAAPLLLSACILSPLSVTDEEPAGERSAGLVLEYGTSFGECLGYCVNELTLTHEEVVLRQRGWEIGGTLPDREYTWPMDADRWARITAAFDADAFAALDAVYGCPDCADGGAEWIEAPVEGEPKRVTFEYGDPPAAVADLQALLRDLLDQKRPN